jgi:NADPH:quinone reductase-like Zn-dependent oxidoreductase
MVPPGGVLGLEAAGVVESIGPGLMSLKPGDRVAYACGPPGAYTTLRNMPSEMLVKLPDELSDVKAAALLLKGMTASFLLDDVHAVKPGDSVLIHAAAGGVGQILCRWTKAIGGYVIGVTSTDAKADVARRAGCDEVLLARQADLVEEVHRLSGGRGVDVVYDAAGADRFEMSIACLAPRGHVVSFRASVRRYWRALNRRAGEPLRHVVAPALRPLYRQCREGAAAGAKAVQGARVRRGGCRSAADLPARGCSSRPRRLGRPCDDGVSGAPPLEA